MYPTAHCTTVYNSQDAETALMANERWTGKEDVVPICNGIYIQPQKNEMESLGEMWMDLETIIQSKVNQRKKKTEYNMKPRKMVQRNLFSGQEQRQKTTFQQCLHTVRALFHQQHSLRATIFYWSKVHIFFTF